ncbi:MAG: TIGR03032 family protein [Cyanobacteria bacterium P01_G01_bin.54]
MTQAAKPPLALTCSRHLIPWLYDQHLSLVFTTYQTNRLFLVGLKPNGDLSIFERLFDRPMGLYATAQRLYLSCRYQVWQFENTVDSGEADANGYDRCYVPQMSYVTGDLDIHDLALTYSERPIFVNTRYSCLGTLSSRCSFISVWQPPFISKLAPEDRCHLNGLALQDGRPTYVTAVSSTDIIAGWRQHRHRGGCIVEVASNEMILQGLSMPHSPRWYRDRLWLLNSGTGEFGYVDLERQTFEPVVFCPGYLRGLAFHSHWAIVGLSKPRHAATFSGLDLDQHLQQRQVAAICGVMIINLNTGNIDHWLQLDGVVVELYDIQSLPGVRRPTAIGFRTDEICHHITFVQPQPLRPPSD